MAYAEAMDCRFQHEDYENALVFSDQPLTGGTPASQVTVHFRTSKTTSFTYDAGTKLYAGAQYGSDWADGNDGTVLEFRNLLVLYADTKTIDDYGRLAVTLTGKGEGYLIRDGQCVPITWSREKEDMPFTYALEDGAPRNSGRGQELCGGCPTRKRFGPGMTQSQTAASIPATIGMFAAVFCPDFPSGAVGLLDRSKNCPYIPRAERGMITEMGSEWRGDFFAETRFDPDSHRGYGGPGPAGYGTGCTPLCAKSD